MNNNNIRIVYCNIYKELYLSRLHKITVITHRKSLSEPNKESESVLGNIFLYPSVE